MAPLLRRSWNPRGCTPIIRQRTRSHQKVSIIAALCLNHARDRLHLYFRLHPQTNITTAEVIDFLRQLSRQVTEHIVLVWDRFNPHRSHKTRAFLRAQPRLHAFFLPPYAPELNPVENFWSYLKGNPLANAAIAELEELTDTTRHHGRRIQRRQSLLRAFLEHSPLSLHLK